MKKSLSILLICGLISCHNSNQKETVNTVKEEFIELSQGLFVEKFDSLNTNENRYNADNKIYLPKLKFKYRYSIIQDGKERFVNSFRKGWAFVNKSDTSALENYFEIEVLYGNPMKQYVSDYYQTAIKFSYADGYNSITGLIENSRNLWLHPPRAGVFSILQLSSFPYIKYPIKKNNAYSWSLISGSHYSDKRFLKWEGNLNTNTNYEVSSIEKINTDLGVLECYIIDGRSVNELGTGITQLYYNNKYGFVKIEFTSIDGTQINIELIEVSESNNG